jgi:hypothetical protein
MTQKTKEQESGAADDYYSNSFSSRAAVRSSKQKVIEVISYKGLERKKTKKIQYNTAMNLNSTNASREGGNGVASAQPPSSTGGAATNTNIAGRISTFTITETPTQTNTPEVLTLSLQARPAVTW